MSWDFLLQVFFNHLPPSPWYYHWGRFEFSKIRRDICKSRCTSSTKPVVNIPPGLTPLLVQIIWTIPDCLHLKVNSKEKICPIKTIKTFLIEDFVHLPPVSITPQWCTLSSEYLREFSKKIETALIGYSGAWGKLIHEKKNPTSKISWHCPFNRVDCFGFHPLTIQTVDSF